MPTPIFPTAWEVETRGMLFGQKIENVWHVVGPDPFSITLASDIADIFSVGMADIMNSFSQQWTLGEIFVHNLAGAASGEFTLAISPPQAGGVAGDSAPSNAAICISLRTNLSGRSTRGRKYFSGLTTTDATNDVFNATKTAAVVTAINTLIANLSGNGTPLAIFSRTIPALTTVVTATAVDNAIDSQRRRLLGRGR